MWLTEKRITDIYKERMRGYGRNWRVKNRGEADKGKTEGKIWTVKEKILMWLNEKELPTYIRREWEVTEKNGEKKLTCMKVKVEEKSEQ